MLPKRLIYQSDLASVPENRTMSLPSHSGLYCIILYDGIALEFILFLTEIERMIFEVNMVRMCGTAGSAHVQCCD